MSYSSDSTPIDTHFEPEKENDLQHLMCSFLKEHTAYDVLPVSYRLIVFDTRLLVKKALNVLVQNGIDSYLKLGRAYLYIYVYIYRYRFCSTVVK